MTGITEIIRSADRDRARIFHAGLPVLAGKYARTVLLAGAMTISAQTLAQNPGGTPLYGTANLNGGFSPDPHVIELLAGGPDEVDDLDADCTGYITSGQPDYRVEYEPSDYLFGIFINADQDTTLIVNAPDGSWHCNDDSSSLDASNPGLMFKQPLAGQYDIWVGTYDSEAVDVSARLVLTEQEESAWLAMDTSATETAVDDAYVDELLAEIDAMLAEDAEDFANLSGTLEAGDSTLAGYGYADNFSFSAQSGQQAVIDLRSETFDTYLVVRSPAGEEFTNDDYDGSTDRSLLSLALTESGTYEVTVSSFMSDETGDYSLDVNVTGSNLADAAPSSRTETGELEDGDTTLSSGEYVDTFEIEGRPGQSLNIELSSDDFDTYLILQSPSGEQEENDDADSTNRSAIVTNLSELGTYHVMVTSYESGNTGDYELNMSQSNASITSTENERDVIALSIGEPVSGDLVEGDLVSDEGMLEDSFWFQGNAGETLRVRVTSNDFDTYLGLLTPDGEAIENDDFEGNTGESVVDLTLRESGRYRVLVTSYGAGGEGSYVLSAEPLSERLVIDDSSGSGGQIYGIFAGISDYPGVDADLSYTDQDATRARDALINGVGMNSGNAVTLLNEEATIDNMRSAIADIASRATSDDTFVLFYSGHGSRIERPDGPSTTDPDGIDETIELYDGSVLDDELSAMLDTINTGTTLLVLDSCFSGGFAKDIIARPGRMGLFSSEEDVTSQVAAKFRAGGYLSVFFEEALEGFADIDENGELTALELSEYVHDRFRVDVKSFGLDQYVRTGGPQSGYQHLVVDRGGVGPYNVLFNHR